MVDSIRQKIIDEIKSTLQTIQTPETYDSIRQRIIDAIKVRFGSVRISLGYQMDLGLNVFEFKVTPFSASDIPGIDFRDVGVDHEDETFGKTLNTMEVEVTIPTSGTTTSDDLREAVAEIEKAIGVDPTWGGLAILTRMVSDRIEIKQEENKIGAIMIVLIIHYLTTNDNPYSN